MNGVDERQLRPIGHFGGDVMVEILRVEVENGGIFFVCFNQSFEFPM